MSEKATGIVERIVANGKRTALKIGDDWYSTFNGINGTTEGALVEITYQTVVKEGRTYRNIKSIETLEGTPAESPGIAREDGEPTPARLTAKDAQIARSVALKAAVEWSQVWKGVDDGVREPETVVKVAEAFLEFLKGG